MKWTKKECIQCHAYPYFDACRALVEGGYRACLGLCLSWSRWRSWRWRSWRWRSWRWRSWRWRSWRRSWRCSFRSYGRPHGSVSPIAAVTWVISHIWVISATPVVSLTWVVSGHVRVAGRGAHRHWAWGHPGHRHLWAFGGWHHGACRVHRPWGWVNVCHHHWR